ncbi:PspC domain-containing protein [Baekduia soli]|nr:PspC domain-containing protein [Baekduia soli]
MPDAPPSSPDPSSPDPAEASTTPAPADEAPTMAGPEPAAGGQDGRRRLLRSREDRVIGGVCGGLARSFGIDPLIVRIAAVALIFVGGAAVVAYLAAMLLVPDDDGTGRPVRARPSRLATVLGAGAVVLAGVLLLDGSWGLHAGWAFGAGVPLAIVAILVAIAGQRLLHNRGEQQPTLSRIVGAALVLCGTALALLILAVGAAWATAAGGGTVVAIVVIALGVAMVALSFRTPRARWLILPALVLAVPAGVVSAAGIDTKGGIGQRTSTPSSPAELQAGGYELGTGEIVVDLRRMTWPADRPVPLKLDLGIGHALVLVPADTCVQSRAHVGAGYIDILGSETGGADVDDRRGTVRRASGPRLVLDAHAGLGAVEVRHSRRDDRFGPRDHAARGSITADLAARGCAGEPA